MKMRYRRAIRLHGEPSRWTLAAHGKRVAVVLQEVDLSIKVRDELCHACAGPYGLMATVDNCKADATSFKNGDPRG